MSEEALISRVEAVMFPTAPEPKVATPEPELPVGLDAEDAALIEPPEQPEDQPEQPFDGVELELGGEVKRLTKAELKALAEEHGALKGSANDLKAQREAVAQERRVSQEIAKVAPMVESIRAEARLVWGALDGLNKEIASLAQSDPIAAYQKREAANELQQRLSYLMQQEGQAAGYYNQLAAQQMAAQVTAEWPRLLEKLPQWKDEGKRKADQTFIREYMQREGYSAEEVNLATRSHYISTLLKAAKYDAIRAGQAAKKVNGAPPIAKPGVPSTGGTSQATARTQFNKAVAGAKSDSERAKLAQKRLAQLL